MFEALKPWLNHEMWASTRKKEEGKAAMDAETQQLAKEALKKMGVEIPEGVELEIRRGGEDLEEEGTVVVE